MASIEGKRTTLFRSLCTAFVLLATVGLGGCGDAGSERAMVSGAVSYQGVPIEKGEIYFIPDETRPSTMARITDGAYRIIAKGGVPVGSHRVEIKAFRDSAASANDELAIGGAAKQYLPPRYNKESELRITIDSTSDETSHDFHLK